MARGVVGRATASDERNRQGQIKALLLNTLARLGGPVFRKWHEVAHELCKVRRNTEIPGRYSRNF